MFNVESLANVKFLASLSGWQVLKSEILFFQTRKTDASFPSSSSKLPREATSLSLQCVQAPEKGTLRLDGTTVKVKGKVRFRSSPQGALSS